MMKRTPDETQLIEAVAKQVANSQAAVARSQELLNKSADLVEGKKPETDGSLASESDNNQGGSDSTSAD